MLVVHRKVGERIVLSGGIEITVVSSSRGGVRLAVTAPRDVVIARGEVHDAVAFSNAAAAATRTSIFSTMLHDSEAQEARQSEAPR
jgi:carbon storage regulator CsrA